MSKEVTTEKELNDELQARNKAAVLFYASWCPYSMRFLPVFENRTAGKDHCLRFVIDADESIADKYGINAYPTIILFDKGKAANRLDGIPHEGLDENMLTKFIDSCGAFNL